MEGRTDFREMLGGNGTNRQILSVHGPLPFSKCFPIIKPFSPFSNPVKYTGHTLCPIKERGIELQTIRSCNFSQTVLDTVRRNSVLDFVSITNLSATLRPELPEAE